MCAAVIDSSIIDLGLDFVASAAQTVWFEFVLFAGTILISMALKAYLKKTESAKLRKKVCDIQETYPKREGPNSGGTARDYSMQSGMRKRAPSHMQAASSPAQESARVLDVVCEMSRHGAHGSRHGTALDMYKDMQLKGHHKNILEFERCSKHTALDFYNSLVSSAIRCGKEHMIHELIADMRSAGVARTNCFYESVMKMLAGKKIYKLALEMHDELVRDGLEPAPATCSCLVSFAVEVGNQELAISFFNKLCSMQCPSIRACMTILRVHAKRGDWASSVAVLKDMQKQGLKLDTLILNIVLATCVGAGQLTEAEALLAGGDGSKLASLADVISYNTVIKGYAQHGAPDKAFEALKRMSDLGLQPNNITFNTIMDAAVRGRRPADAWRILPQMRAAGLVPDKYTCSIMVKALHEGADEQRIRNGLELLKCVDSSDASKLLDALFSAVLSMNEKENNPALVREICEQMQKQGSSPSLGTYAGIIKTRALEGDIDGCFLIWDEFLRMATAPRSASLSGASQPQPHVAVFAALFEVCVNRGHVDRGLKALESARCALTSGKEASGGGLGALYSTAIRTLCKSQRTDLAAEYLTEAMKEGCAIDITTYTILLKSQCEHVQLEAAVCTLGHAKQAGLRPDESMLNALLTACFKGERPDLGKHIFQDLTQGPTGVRPNQTTLSALIRLYGRCERLEEAFAAIDALQEKYGLEMSSQAYNCIMRACVRNKQTQRALDLFSEMKQKTNLKPDTAMYSTLISGCMFAKLFAQGVNLAEEAFQHGTAVPSEVIESLAAALARKRPTAGCTLSEDLRRLIETQKVPLSSKSR